MAATQRLEGGHGDQIRGHDPGAPDEERPKSPSRVGSATVIIVELSGASMAPSTTVTRIVRSAVRRSETIPVALDPRSDTGDPGITRDNPEDASGVDQNLEAGQFS